MNAIRAPHAVIPATRRTSASWPGWSGISVRAGERLTAIVAAVASTTTTRVPGTRANQACPVMRSPLPTTSARSWENDRLDDASTNRPIDRAAGRVICCPCTNGGHREVGYPVFWQRQLPNFDDEPAGRREAV